MPGRPLKALAIHCQPPANRLPIPCQITPNEQGQDARYVPDGTIPILNR